MCWDYEQIICKQKAMITMVILLGWTGDVHIAPLCFNTCREVCSSFMSSSLLSFPELYTTILLCIYSNTYCLFVSPDYNFHEGRANIFFCLLKKGTMTACGWHFSMYYRRKHEPGRKGSHQLEDTGNQAIRPVPAQDYYTVLLTSHFPGVSWCKGGQSSTQQPTLSENCLLCVWVDTMVSHLYHMALSPWL